jgi:hypothetical protein
MQVAKATPEDIKATFSVNNILELLQSNQMPEDWLEETDGDDWFDKGSDAQCATAMRKLLETINTGAMFRVAIGMSVLTDPANKIINPDSDVLEFHPEIEALKAAQTWQPIETAPKQGFFRAWHSLHECEIVVEFCGFPLENGVTLIEKTRTTGWPIDSFSRWAPITTPEITK